MKKILTLAAAAALFTGCDFAGGADGPAVTIANVTVSDIPVAAGSTPVVEIQDIGGRAYFRAEIQPGAALGGFEITAPNRDLYVVVMGMDAQEIHSVVAVSDVFTGGELTGDATLDLHARGTTTVVGQATLDLP
jgi:hypothetical protein